jgi:hypothetical protein
MGTFTNIVGIRNDRTKVSAVRRRIGAAVLALGILAIATGIPRLSHADTSSAPPVSQCTDFACQGRSPNGSKGVSA